MGVEEVKKHVDDLIEFINTIECETNPIVRKELLVESYIKVKLGAILTYPPDTLKQELTMLAEVDMRESFKQIVDNSILILIERSFEMYDTDSSVLRRMILHLEHLHEKLDIIPSKHFDELALEVLDMKMLNEHPDYIGWT